MQAKKGLPSDRMKNARVSCTRSRPLSLGASPRLTAASKTPWVRRAPAPFPAEPDWPLTVLTGDHGVRKETLQET